MNELKVLQDAAALVHQNVKSLAGTENAAGDFGRGAGGDISKNIDIVAEKTVLDHLKSIKFPCTVLGEECGRVEISDNPQGYVIMDAIDGTTNAVRGFPFYSCSLAYASGETLSSVTAGVVMNLYNGETYWASKGGGAFLDGNRIRVGRGDPRYHIVGVQVSGITMNTLKRIHPIVNNGYIRSMGSNALELSILSRGLMDAFVDLRDKIRIQDLAAAYCIVREAGGLIFDENFKDLDGDLEYGTHFSFIATADMEMANAIAVKLGMAPLAGFEHASQP